MVSQEGAEDVDQLAEAVEQQLNVQEAPGIKGEDSTDSEQPRQNTEGGDHEHNEAAQETSESSSSKSSQRRTVHVGN
ncbi:hypothetical protein BGW38_008128, partial [Lunasporangiospora selenospora]